MRRAQATRATARARALNLSVDTNVNDQSDIVTETQIHNATATQTLTAPLSQHKLDADGVKVKPSKPSQALANPNWRNRETAPGTPLTTVNATGLHKIGSKKSDGPASNNGYDVRHYRTTPIDPDFIHSAPLTKKDYGDTKSESDYNSSDSDVKLYTGRPGLVKLEKPSTATNQSFGAANLGLKRHKEGDQWVDEWQYGNSPLSAIPIPQANPSNVGGPITFPLANVQAINESRRFKSGTWGELDEQIQKQLSELEVPLTAGLLTNHSDQKYEDGKNRAAIEPADRDDYSRKTVNPAASNQASDERMRYSSLIEKLNTPSDFYFAGDKMRAIGRSTNAGSTLTLTEHKSQEQGKLSINGVGYSQTKVAEPRGKSLNPTASEFRSSGQLTNGPWSSSSMTHYNMTTPMSSDSPNTQTIAGNETQQILEGIRVLREELAELRLLRLHVSYDRSADFQQQINHLQDTVNGMSASLGFQTSTPDAQSQMALVHVPRQEGQYKPQQSDNSVHQQGFQLYGSHPDSQLALVHYSGPAQTQRYFPGMYDSPVMNGSAPSAPPYVSTNGHDGSGYNSHGYGSTGYVPVMYAPPVYGVSGPSSMQSPMLQNTTAATFGDPTNYGNLSLPQQAQLAFGPKPVTKPRGPPRMGDPHFSQQQNNYERYLEEKRATDPVYAQQCKERQARRSERERRSRQS